jgi:sRNA-binding protein
MAAFEIGDQVELRTSATATRGKVIGVRKDSIRVTWEQRFGSEGTTTTERPEDLRNLSR